MRILFLLFFLGSFCAAAFEVKSGNYKLVDGDEDFCEEGYVNLTKGDLKIGSRLVFLQINKAQFNYESDDGTCFYNVKTTSLKNGFNQEITHKCKDGTYKRNIFLNYLHPKLSYTILADDLKHKKIHCSLEFGK